LDNFKRDLAWFKANYDDIKLRFKGRFIAIKDKEIVDSDRDVMELFKRLNRRLGNKNDKYYDISTMVIEYIDEFKAQYILSTINTID